MRAMGLRGSEIAVVGAGIGGVAAATALARRGARVTVFEQAPAREAAGAGIQITPNGVAVLEALGVRAALAPHASLPPAVELRDWRAGRLVAELPLGESCAARYRRPYWQLHRADLVAALATAAATAGARLRLGVAVVATEPTGSGVRLRTGAGEALAADLLVAADGIRSGVRAARFDPRPARFTGHAAWRALVPADRLPPWPAATTVTMGPARHLVSYPLRAGRLVNLVAVEERAAWTSEGWTTPDDPENLRRAFSGWGGAAGELLAAVDRTYLWGLFDHPPLRTWVRGRIALLGDACHPMLPFLAQGATMAIEDAWVLADALDRAPDPDRGLADYVARRLARTARTQRAAAGAGRLYHLGPGLRQAAHAGLGAVSALAPTLLLRRFDWLYGADVTGSSSSTQTGT
jgi:salicylate hydroxylase